MATTSENTTAPDILNGFNLSLGVFLALLIGVALTYFGRSGSLPDSPDQFTYDLRTYFLVESAKEPRTDLAIVLIDEESLRGYPYLSPVDRELMAIVVERLDEAGVRAIGLDFFYDRPSERKKDELLVNTLRRISRQTPIVVGSIDERSAGLPYDFDYQEKFIKQTGVIPAHIYFATRQKRLSLGDDAARFIVEPSTQHPERLDFASALAKLVGNNFVPDSQLIYWRHPPTASGADFIPTFSIPAHRDTNGRRIGSVFPDAWLDALKGRIVLVGGAFFDRDKHLTPLSVVSGVEMSGVKIHGQILAQLLDKKEIYDLPFWVEMLVVAAVALAGFISELLWKFTRKQILSATIAFAFIVTLSSILFVAVPTVLPTATLFLAWPLGMLSAAQTNYWMGSSTRKRAKT